jgi:hypothetical protein
VARVSLTTRSRDHKCFDESPTATFVGFKQHYAFVLSECEPMLKPHQPENAEEGEREEFGGVTYKSDNLLRK